MHGDMYSLTVLTGLLQEKNQDDRGHYESDGTPTGITAQLGFDVPSLVLAEERFRPAGNGTADACRSTGLQQDYDDDDKAQQDVKDVDDDR